MSYWLGKSYLFLPEGVRKLMVEKYALIDVGSDVSTITDPNVFFCFLYADKDFDEELLMMCIRICNNLSKSLIVFHEASVPSRFLNDEIVYASVDLSQSQHIKQIAYIETKLRRDNIYTSQTQGRSVTQSKNISTLRKSVHETDTITNVLAYIEKHYAGTLRERDVADHCHLSIPYFSRMFHQEIGESFRDYVSHKRISLAKQLLKANPRQQISAIAYQCGFNDVSYFSRMFKKKTGMSPGTYRNIGGTIDLATKDN